MVPTMSIISKSKSSFIPDNLLVAIDSNDNVVQLEISEGKDPEIQFPPKKSPVKRIKFPI